MIKPELIEEIISLYEKHGWTLRRVLISDAVRVSINERLQDLFRGVEMVSSPFLNALWFSRPSGKSDEAWELRHLSANPFALVEVFSAGDDEEKREKILKDTENLLSDKIANRN